MASEHHPDLVFKLIISPEESVRRKPENKLEVIKQKHELNEYKEKLNKIINDNNDIQMCTLLMRLCL